MRLGPVDTRPPWVRLSIRAERQKPHTRTTSPERLHFGHGGAVCSARVLSGSGALARASTGKPPGATFTQQLARRLLSGSTMRNPLLLTSAIACFALTACGGSSEPAKSPDDSDRAAEKASDAAEKAEDKADKAADKADDAAHDANEAAK